MALHPKTLVALATYNERENLPELLREIFRLVPWADVFVVDDNSPDGTGFWATEHARTERRLTVLNRPGKLGLGTAVRAAMERAVALKYDYLDNLDADFSHPVEKIPVLIEEAVATAADVVIGSRYVAGGDIIGWPPKRRRMSRWINFYTKTLLGLTTADNSGSFRCYRRSALERLLNGPILSNGYSFFEEVLFRIKQNGGTFSETAITFTERRRGVSKINRTEAIKALWIIFRLGLFK